MYKSQNLVLIQAKTTEKCTRLINEIGNEKHKGEYTGDECTYPDVFWLATGSFSDGGCSRWPPMPVSTLNNTVGEGEREGRGVPRIVNILS